MASPSKDGTEGPAPKARELTSKVLDFLSTASNETLGACVVGLGAVTYLVLGRVGLVLIGAVGGVVLHATWEDQRKPASQDAPLEAKRRKEVGADIVKRLLDLQDKQNIKNGEIDNSRGEVEVLLSRRKELNFDDFQPATGAALYSLVDAVIRDYVKYWYSPVLPKETSFPFACRQTLTSFILAFSNHLSRKRPADTFLNFLTNSTSIFIVFLGELSHALMAPGMYDRDVSEAIHIYLSEKPDSNLASVLNTDQHEKKFSMVADDVLQTFLDSKAYNCEPVKVFLREILAGVILESVLKSCSQPEWINSWIVYLLEEGEPEIMNAIDVGVGGATGKEVANSTAQQDLNSAAAKKELLDTEGLESPQQESSHQRKVSKAETAMEEAMQEAKRLSELIAQEDAKKVQQDPPLEDLSSSMASTEPFTEQAITPTSSQSDSQAPNPDLQMPRTEDDTNSATSAEQATLPVAQKSFTSFDQILPPQQHGPFPSEQVPDSEPLTLHRANVTIFDDAQPGDKSTIKSKPMAEYLLQIEPRTSRYPGWMTARKYPDFETLHEVLRRIAPISGVPEFNKKQATLPDWRKKTKTVLCTDLEGYLRDALSFEPLAESEGMKRFLEKEQQLGRPTPTKGVLGFPTPEAFQSMGKGMLDVLGAAPKGAASGGKAIVGGVSGIFGGQKKSSSSPKPQQRARTNTESSQPRRSEDPFKAAVIPSASPRPSQDSYASGRASSTDNIRPPLPTRPSVETAEQRNALGVLSGEKGDVFGSQNSSIVDVSRPESEKSALNLVSKSELDIQLPPPPSEIADDYSSITESPKKASKEAESPLTSNSSTMPVPQPSSPLQASSTAPIIEEPKLPTVSKAKSAHRTPLDEQETQVAIELIFAVINELYTLSSAWNIRRTLLNAAKTYLLRPGNPQLEAIRVLLQDTVIEANTTDAGLATHILKLRENSLPTEEELAAWPPPLGGDAREKLRAKARKLLVHKGMPQALTSVMGLAASGEALGRVFDALQEPEVSRGLMFALLLQGVRAVTH